MHVCLVGVEYPKDTNYGGIATYQKRMAKALVNAGCKVTVICGSPDGDKDYYEDKIHVIRLYTSRINETEETFEAYRLRVKDTILEIDSKDKIDIIETPEFSGEIIEFLKNRHIPVVVKLHTSYKIWSNLNNKKLEKGLHNKIINSEEKAMLYADKIVSCSNILKEIISKYHKGLNLKEMDIIPNPADIENFYPIKANHNSKTILYCGSFEKRKGVLQLAKAIPLVVDIINDDELKFQLIGNYNGVEQGNKSSKDLFLDLIPQKYHKYIEFLGHIDNEELNKYYNEARIGVVPSLFDNLPYVAMEELLTELPLVASNNTGIKEMIENNKSGILYNPNDYEELAKSIIKLYNDREFAQVCGKNGRKNILEKFAPEKVAQKNIELYERTISIFEKKKSRRLHVCLTNFEYPSETSLGGIATYQKRIADALVKAGCKVTVIAGSFCEYSNYYDNDIHVYRIPKNFPYKNKNDYYSYRKRLSSLINEINEFEKIDIIESPELSAELITYIKNKTIPVVTKLHTSYTIIKRLNEGFSMFPKEIEDIIEKNENIILNMSDKIMCCSNILKELMPTYHKGDNLDEIIVIPNPADIENFYPIKANHNSKTILYCGNFIKRKGIFQLAKAIPLVVDAINDEELKFQLIGNYNGVEQGNKSSKDFFLDLIPQKYHKYIEFLGQIENKKLNKYYNEARIGVVPSLFDNLPYVAMEELLTELPLVASNNTGIKEMIENNKSGILYNPNDYEELAKSIIKLYNDREFAQECGKNGRKNILEKFAPEKVAQKNIELYERTIREFNDRYKLDLFCKKHNIKNNSLKKEKFGGANFVRKCMYNKEPYILKIYNKDYAFSLIDMILENVDNANHIILKDNIEGTKIYLYTYIKGQHKSNYTTKNIQQVLLNINKIQSINVSNIDCNKWTIFNKFNKYIAYFKYQQIIKSDLTVIQKLLEVYKELEINEIEEKLVPVHGDLSFSNIIWVKSKPYFIDFDECTLAPIEYEYMSFLIKSCFNNNFFNIELAKKILKSILEQSANLSHLKKYYYFYILKVIIEKIYYCETANLDLDSVSQLNDHWTWWYNLLLNDYISNVLFDNNELNTNDFEQIKIITENNKKFLLKKSRISYNKFNSNEQMILANLKGYVPVAGLLSFKRLNDKFSLKKYEFFDGEQIKNDYLSKLSKVCFIEVKKMHQRLKEITKYIDCPFGSVIEKLDVFYNSTNDDFIKKVITELKEDVVLKKQINEEVVIIHDDLNHGNILYNKHDICIIDFEGLRKYPKTMQLASFIVLHFICEKVEFDINLLVSQWDEYVELNYLIKLIVFRLIKVYTYYETNPPTTKEDMRRMRVVYKAIKEWRNKI